MKVFKRFSTTFLALTLCLSFLFSTSLTVYASSEFIKPDNWDSMTSLERLEYCLNDDTVTWENLPTDICNDLNKSAEYMAFELGFVFSTPSTAPIAKGLWTSYQNAKDKGQQIVTNDGAIPSSVVNSFNETVNEYYEANAPKFKILDTVDYTRVPASGYSSKMQYDAMQDLLEKHSEDIIFNFTTNTNSYIYAVNTDDVEFFVLGRNADKLYVSIYNADWVEARYFFDGLSQDEKKSFSPSYIYRSAEPSSGYQNLGFFSEFGSYWRDRLCWTTDSISGEPVLEQNITSTASFSYKNGKPIMVFASREDAVDYITKTSSIYKTVPTYKGGDLIIPKGALSFDYNAIYNSIYDAIKDSNDKGNPLTPEQIQAMIDKSIAEALNSINNTPSGGGDGGGSGGDTNITVSGSDYGDVGDIVSSLPGVMDSMKEILPSSLTSFFSELLPFIPSEYFSAVKIILTIMIVLTIFKLIKELIFFW